jgi:general secretion pathway protein J
VTTARRGFTLIEVLIAVAITSAMGVMTLGAFRQVYRAQEIARAQGDRYAGARLALTRLARELSMAFLSDHYDKYTSRAYRERPTVFVGSEDQVLFATFAHVRLARDAKESDQAVVEYVVEASPDTAGEQALFRREKPRIDDEPERGGRKDLVADHVRGLRLEYWDTKRKDWAREWTTRQLEHKDELPSRVRIALEVTLADGRAETFTTETRIALTRPLDF